MRWHMSRKKTHLTGLHIGEMVLVCGVFRLENRVAMKNIIYLISTVLALVFFGLHTSLSAEKTLSLDGEWAFQLDPENVGVTEGWFKRTLDDTIKLPGTTDENRKGIQHDEKPTDRLMRPWFWKGAAWYQREVIIPEAWSGKHVTLFLERTKNTRVWVDGVFYGWEDTLSAPQVFDVTKAMKPGKRIITLLIDNAKIPPVGPAHAIDERTQTNWNGIVGRMELRATDPVWIDDIQIYPDAAKMQARVRVLIGNTTGMPATGKIHVACESYNIDRPESFNTMTVELNAPQPENIVEFIYEPGGNVPLWDEFQPALLRLDLRLEVMAGDVAFSHRQSGRFGMRDFTRDGPILKINGRPLLLRGRLDCANYPLTGYAPMDKAEWLRLLRIHKDWGINHVRYHSWCPPAAAFEAADELGLYLQAELPNKRSAFNAPDSEDAAYHNIDRLEIETTATDVNLYDYAKREGELISRHFGNHPSFTLFTLGNELGRNKGMFDLVSHFKKNDPRQLHAQGANNMHWDPSYAEGDDFWVTGKVLKDAKPLRGSFSHLDFPNPHIESFPPSTMFDFTASLEGIQVPLIGHETGQFQVYPDFRDIPKFTGVTRARNYEIFRDRLDAAGMLDQAHDFVRASGALSAICYREDIEAALRTPGFGGFQLLDIMDFPGQGTALVGMLNAFMESKGVIEPEIWRGFCSETVPLLRMEKYTWTASETFTGKIQVAHYGPNDMADAVVAVTIAAANGNEVASLELPAATIRTGGLVDIGEYCIPLASEGIKPPCKLTITLAIKGTAYRNSWPLWVYPPEIDANAPEGVLVTRSFADRKTRAHLASGGKVLLVPDLGKLPHSVEGSFQTEFWSPMFAEASRKRGVAEPPGTLGMLCDPEHPALAGFPTGFHSDWQWWHLVKNARPIILDGTPDDYRPIVQVVDNFARNHKLGLVAETKVGKGTMLVCAIDLLGHQDKPEARQLLHSLLRYMDSQDFAPDAGIDTELLEKLFPE